MRILLLLSLLALLLPAATLREYTLYTKSDHVDLMLTFDAPYPGRITRMQKEGVMTLMLDGVAFNRPKVHRKVASDLLDTVTLEGDPKGMRITLAAKAPLQVTASKTIDNTGLRLRIEKKSLTEDSALQPIPAPQAQTTAKPPFDFSFALIKIMLVLAGLILFLWLLKRWIERRRGGAWLFGEQGGESGIRIVAQKPIDMRNRVTLIAYEEKQYLVLLGENALLLDRFEDEEAAFERLLQKHGKRLGEYLEK